MRQSVRPFLDHMYRLGETSPFGVPGGPTVQGKTTGHVGQSRVRSPETLHGTKSSMNGRYEGQAAQKQLALTLSLSVRHL
jgi:hypothetical protein